MKEYFVEVWGEVRPESGKVTWPNREEVRGSTFVVVVTVAMVTVYLFVIDVAVGWLMARLLGVQRYL